MRRLFRDESGFTLPELLTVTVVMTVILTATLATLESYTTRNRTNTKQNESQDQARQAIDRLARQMRNLARPTDQASTSSVKSIDLAGDDDLVFKTEDQLRRRVRYCRNSADAQNEKVYLQEQASSTGNPAMPSVAACPAATSSGGWVSSTIVAEHVMNGTGRPLFGYTGYDGSDTSTITAVRANLVVDVTPGTRPKEVALSSGVYLRNQNQRPTATFTATQNPAGSRTYVLNGSQSSDFEGRTLEFVWYRGTGDVNNLPDCKTDATQSGAGFTCLGLGINLTATLPSGSQTVTLKVTDPGDLRATAQQTKVVP